MTKATAPLLPQGLRDRLPDEAAAASHVTRALVDALRSHGYARVAPPIAEYRETFASDSDANTGGNAGGSAGGEATGRDLLRFTDPVSQRTLAIRPDITRQIGRIVTSRLAAAARPLRLAYAGQVVKLSASALWPERELLQVGAELVGSDSVAAVCEIVGVAVDALNAAGVRDITVDLTLPDLVDTLAASTLPLLPAHIDAVKAELDAKDAGALEALGASAYLPLIAASGPFARAIARLRAIDAGGALATRITALDSVAAHIGDRATVTLDPTERHGFEYQSWFGFSLFVAGHAVSIGRGGSYSINHGDGRQETAVGFSLYPDPLIAAGLGAQVDAGQHLFLPLGHDAVAAAQLRAAGWVTVAALEAHDDGRALGCSHQLDGRGPVAY